MRTTSNQKAEVDPDVADMAVAIPMLCILGLHLRKKRTPIDSLFSHKKSTPSA